jgi:hypothetical protein
MAEQHPDDLHADFETRSRTDLKKAGARKYAADPSTRITTAVWHFRGRWKTACTVHPHLGTHTLIDLFLDVRECRRFVAHNAAFDVSILHASNPFDRIPVEKIDCTMGRAQSLSLPGGLDDVNKALGIAGKDPRGKQLVMATCKPKKDGTFNEDLQTFKKLLEYNRQDVRCLIELDRQLPALSPAERLVFERTWRKNDRGLPVDVELAQAIASRRQDIEEEAQRKLLELTGGVVTKISQRQRILKWCASKGARIDSTQKHIIAETLADDSLDSDVRLLLELLQESGGSAPLKAQSVLDRQVDGSYKDGTRYFGARSGRGTSEGANMFNIARPSGKYDGEDGRPTIDSVIDGLKMGFNYDNTALTDCLRGVVQAPPGYKIIDIDLSNAEYRLAMWLADDRRRLEMLANNEDPYMYNAIAMGWCPPGSTKKTHPKERTDSKPLTLGANYQLGWKTYMAHQRRSGRAIVEDKARSDISSIRKANPLLVELWDALGDTFRQCIYDKPGRRYNVHMLSFQKDDNGTVWLILPSGRGIPHYSAHITNEGQMAFYRAKFGAMREQKIFGGGILEIFCQGTTRDLLTLAEADIENELPDVTLLLDVYDSILALAPEDVADQRAKEMRAIMRRVRTWAQGLPVDAEFYVADRMKK